MSELYCCSPDPANCWICTGLLSFVWLCCHPSRKNKQSVSLGQMKGKRARGAHAQPGWCLQLLSVATLSVPAHLPTRPPGMGQCTSREVDWNPSLHSFLLSYSDHRNIFLSEGKERRRDWETGISMKKRCEGVGGGGWGRGRGGVRKEGRVKRGNHNSQTASTTLSWYRGRVALEA